MATQDDLEDFRKQWRQELEAHRRQAGLSLTNSNSPLKQKEAGKQAVKHADPHASTHRRKASLSFVGEGQALGDHSEGHASASKHEGKPLKAPVTALEHFEWAVEAERQGLQGESLQHYRKAFRLDDKVDTKYREKHFPKSAIAAAKQQKHGSKPISHHAGDGVVDELAKSFAGIKIGGKKPKAEGEEVSQEEVPEEVESESPLAQIPSEILLHILRDVALMDVASFARLATVCKAFAYIVTTEEGIWREVCKGPQGFGHQVWNWKKDIHCEDLDFDDDDEDVIVEEEPDDETMLLEYEGSWRRMFRDRPRIHYNGIYISTCNYFRHGHGSASSATWNGPVHIVTYYRYLRFYPEGSCLSYLTTEAPSVVVPVFGRANSGHNFSDHLFNGRWMMSGDGCLNIDMLPNSRIGERYSYHMEFTVKTASGSSLASSAKGGRRNRLIWRSYYSRHRITDDIAEFERKNDKPFVFSRVGWIEREMGIV